MIWLTLAGAVTLYIVGFLLGRKYERDSILDETVGVMAQINKTNDEVESVTYFYSQTAYNTKIQELKDNGEEYYDDR